MSPNLAIFHLQPAKNKALTISLSLRISLERNNHYIFEASANSSSFCVQRNKTHVREWLPVRHRTIRPFVPHECHADRTIRCAFDKIRATSGGEGEPQQGSVVRGSRGAVHVQYSK